MNECYGIDAELPSKVYSNADLVCYEIVEPFMYDDMGQYIFTNGGFHHLNNLGEPVLRNRNKMVLELEVHGDDEYTYEGRCFVYVRVNGYLRKHLEKSLLGCEFIHQNNKTEKPCRRFVHSIEARKSGIVVIDQYGLTWYLSEQLLYPDDYSDPIPYQEWVKQINKQDVEVEYGDEYKKVNESSTLVKQLTKSEIESLRQNKRDAYALMMKMN